MSEEEVRRTIERAAALSKADVAAGRSGRRLTAAELERHLRELGLERDAVRRAMDAGAVEQPVAPETSGQLVREVELDGALSSERFEEIAEAIASVMGMEGQTSGVGHKLVWTPGGRMMEPAVTLQVRDGVTRIRYVESMVTPQHAKLGFATLGSMAGAMSSSVLLLGGIGAAKALEITSVEGGVFVLAVAALCGAGATVASFVGLWRRYKARNAQRSAFADEVVARVAEAVRARIDPSVPNARVEAHGEEHEAGIDPNTEESVLRRR